jgi:hypothetical protein
LGVVHNKGGKPKKDSGFWFIRGKILPVKGIGSFRGGVLDFTAKGERFV